jgi:hypothetical protein
MVQAEDPIYRITTEPTESLAELLQRVRQHSGRPVFLNVPMESPLFLTASEFRALRETVRSNGINFTLISDDPHRRDFAQLFNLDATSEAPTHWPTSAPVAPKPPSSPLTADPLETPRQRRPLGSRMTTDADPMASAPPATDNGWGREAAPTSSASSSAPGGWPRKLTPAAAETTSMPVTAALATIPEPPKKRRKWPWLTAIVLLLIAGLVAAAVFVPKATLTLHREATPLSTTVVFAVTPPDAQPASGAAFSVPGTWQQANITAEVTVPATGKQNVPDKVASGSVDFANPTNQSVTLPAGTEITSDGGIVFKLTEAVTVPPATGLKSGTETGSIEAAVGGSNGNLGQGALSGKLPQGVYFSNRNGALTGGTDISAVVVSDDDIQTALSQLEAAIPDQTAKAISATTGQNVAVVPASVEHAALSPVASVQAGTVADQVTVTVATVVNALTYDPSVAQPQIVSTAEQALAPASGTELDMSSMQVGAAQAVEGDTTRTLVSVDVPVNQVPIIDQTAIDDLKNDVRGKSVDEARNTANEIAGVESSDVEIEPSWLPDRLPILPTRIEVMPQ